MCKLSAFLQWHSPVCALTLLLWSWHDVEVFARPPLVGLLPLSASVQVVHDTGSNPKSNWQPSSCSFNRVSTSILSSLSCQTAFVLLLGSLAVCQPFWPLEVAGAADVACSLQVGFSSPPDPGVGKFSSLSLEAINKWSRKRICNSRE
jgi:hypothetical protein